MFWYFTELQVLHSEPYLIWHWTTYALIATEQYFSAFFRANKREQKESDGQSAKWTQSITSKGTHCAIKWSRSIFYNYVSGSILLHHVEFYRRCLSLRSFELLYVLLGSLFCSNASYSIKSSCTCSITVLWEPGIFKNRDEQWWEKQPLKGLKSCKSNY